VKILTFVIIKYIVMDVHEKIEKINTLIFDVDGVFTDGTLIVTEGGDMLRAMNAKDGYSIKRALEMGYNVVIITGGDSVGVEKRFRKLGVKDVYLKINDKLSKYKEYIKKHNILKDEVLYMGDDILDLELLQNVFLSVCPRDASHEVLETCDFISNFDGGKGCVREIVEKVLVSQNKWLPL
jgi:3-deoxy-D-manno-octulosonate 8-phosphate phosphatase (KDO 8-P phosphatase)